MCFCFIRLLSCEVVCVCVCVCIYIYIYIYIKDFFFVFLVEVCVKYSVYEVLHKQFAVKTACASLQKFYFLM